MPQPPSTAASRDAILEAALDLLKERGTPQFTVDAVARKAGCAKGLVHYHFKTKAGLLEAAAWELSERRAGEWESAFLGQSAAEAIRNSWDLLTRESASGVLRAWSALFGAPGVVPDHVVKAGVERFSKTLGRAAHATFDELGLVASVRTSEIGWLLAAVVTGMGLQLVSGADPAELDGAYAAAWLAILSLGERSRDRGRGRD